MDAMGNSWTCSSQLLTARGRHVMFRDQMAHSISTNTFLHAKNTLVDHKLVIQQRHTTFPFLYGNRKSSKDLGSLRTLPAELLILVIKELDLHSVISLCLVNRRAAQFAMSIPEYKRVMLHAPDMIRGALKFGFGHSFSLKTLHKELTKSINCEHCGAVSGYLYLLTCTRICLTCYSTRGAYKPTTWREAKYNFGLAPEDVKALPGKNKPTGPCWTGKEIIDTTSAYDAGLAKHGSIEGMHKYCIDAYLRDLPKDVPWQDTRELKLARQRELWSFTPHDSNPSLNNTHRRHLKPTLVRAPFINTKTDEAEWPVHCHTCRFESSENLHFGRQWEAQSFKYHVLEEEEAITSRKVEISTQLRVLESRNVIGSTRSTIPASPLGSKKRNKTRRTQGFSRNGSGGFDQDNFVVY